MSAEYVNVYQLLKDAGVPLDNHESDLYAEATPEAVAIVKASGWSFTYFRNEATGRLNMDLPFAFTPWWDAKVRS
jgi:hypothetical protein